MWVESSRDRRILQWECARAPLARPVPGRQDIFTPLSPSRPTDLLLRTVSEDGGLGLRVLVATRLVQDAARRHGTLPTASAALGRSLMGAILLAAGTKDGETLQLQLRGDGELRRHSRFG